MTPSRLFRYSLGTLLTSGLLAVCLGACSSSSNEACGVNGLQNGTCQLGPTCPSGTVVLPIADPEDECPGNPAQGGYQCCVPGNGGTSGGSGTGTAPPASDAH